MREDTVSGDKAKRVSEANGGHGRTQRVGAKQTSLSISGMHCAACARRVETALSAMEGVSSAVVNLATERATSRTIQRRSAPIRWSKLCQTLATALQKS